MSLIKIGFGCKWTKLKSFEIQVKSKVTSSPLKGYDPPPFLFSIGYVNCCFNDSCALPSVVFVRYISYNGIIFSLPAQGIHLTSCPNMYTLNWKCLMCPQTLLYFFWPSLVIKCFHFIFAFFLQNTCPCNTHFDWLQLSLDASNSNPNCVTMKIWLTCPRGAMASEDAEVKQWYFYCCNLYNNFFSCQLVQHTGN